MWCMVIQTRLFFFIIISSSSPADGAFASNNRDTASATRHRPQQIQSRECFIMSQHFLVKVQNAPPPHRKMNHPLFPTCEHEGVFDLRAYKVTEETNIVKLHIIRYGFLHTPYMKTSHTH